MKIIFPLLSTLLSLMLIELGLRFYSNIWQVYDLEMWKYAQNLKQPANDARGHAHRPKHQYRVMGQMVVINSKGLRDFEYSYERTSCKRILAIGDSLTFGFGVSQDETFTKIIEQKLNTNSSTCYEVINGGIGNYNTEQELAFLKLEGIKYRPDEIWLNFYINDAEPVQAMAKGFLPKYSMAYVYLKSFIYKLRAQLNPRYTYSQFYNNLYQGNNWTRYLTVLSNFVSFCKENKITLTVNLLPDLHQLSPYPFASIHNQLAQFFMKYNILVIDTVSSFDATKEQSYWVANDDPHPNKRGHEIIAKKILERWTP